MEKITQLENGENIEKKKRGRPRKIKTEEELFQNLKENNDSIPNRKNFDINTIAKFDQSSGTLKLKEVRKDADGKNYIMIGGRKYYELGRQESIIPKSFFQKRGKTLFIGDKAEGTTLWDGVSYRCSLFAGENVHVEERRTRYSEKDGGLYLGELYRSSIHTISETIAAINRNGKNVKITKDMVDRYLSGIANKTEVLYINYAKKNSSEFRIYLENRMYGGIDL